MHRDSALDLGAYSSHLVRDKQDIFSFKNGSATLPDTGFYHFFVTGMTTMELKDVPLLVHCKKFGVVRDTFYIPKIVFLDVNHLGYRFYDCDSLLNGKYNSYYYDGKLKFSGKFKDGNQIDTFKTFYYSTNKLMKSSVVKNRGFDSFEYDTSGTLKSNSTFRRRIFSNRYKVYEDGALVKSERKHFFRLLNLGVKMKEVYYTNNGTDKIFVNLNNKKRKYYSDNKKVAVVKRRKLKFTEVPSHYDQAVKVHDYMYKWKVLDSNRHVLLRVRFRNVKGSDYFYEDKIEGAFNQANVQLNSYLYEHHAKFEIQFKEKLPRYNYATKLTINFLGRNKKDEPIELNRDEIESLLQQILKQSPLLQNNMYLTENY